MDKKELFDGGVDLLGNYITFEMRLREIYFSEPQPFLQEMAKRAYGSKVMEHITKY